MKLNKTLIAVAFLIGFVASAFSQVILEKVSDDSLLQRINSNQPNRVAAIYKSELPGIYEVHTEDRQVLYTDKDARVYFLGGQLVDFMAKVNLTQVRKSKVNAIAWDQLPHAASFVVKKGNGKRSLAVFTDPDCPYCKRLEKDLQTVDNVTISYFLLPIDNLHPAARAKAISVWCSSDRPAAWDSLMLDGRSPEPNSACDHPINTVAQFASAKRIVATPTIINGNGSIIEGSPKRDRLEAFLDLK